MKKVSLLIALALIVTIGGVYATWTYTQSTDIADEAVHKSLNLTKVTYEGTYGTYEINTTNLSMLIDPKDGTVHTTALKITGELVISFTPATYAPEEIKQNAVASTFAFTLSNDNWTYDDDTTDAEVAKPIVTLEHTGTHDISWTREADGTFTYTMDATTLAGHITLTEFTLDTKADYDAYNTELAKGQIVITVSDGITSSGS